MNMARIYAVIGLLALLLFGHYQRLGQGIFDSVANTGRGAGGGAGGHSVYHK